ncbi:uncharacterized protein LOC131615997 isoform X2 [Vicia villosa]|uniref:uncharacterized protein LOC131615997 isoform X2 n=1 Tax=Vicia villosa TaxID=3911 RepID=UPI00273AA00A|nr:uncharacterized protein LOC131615997 isoform X2 [Vicia villosa]
MMLMTMLFSLITFVQDISNNKELWKIAVKVHHKWNVITSTKHHFEMIMIDKEKERFEGVVEKAQTGDGTRCNNLLCCSIRGSKVSDSNSPRKGNDGYSPSSSAKLQVPEESRGVVERNEIIERLSTKL